MKINTAISWILKLALVVLFISLAYLKDYTHAIYALLAIIIFLIPSIIERKYDVYLPWIFDLLIVLPLFIFVFGITFKLYDYEIYSMMSHFVGTIIIALLGFTSALTLRVTNQIKLNMKQIIFFTIIFSMAIGVLWETSEFISDAYFGTHAQKTNADTMLDLIFDTISGIVTSFIGALYIRYMPKRKLNHVVDPFATILKIKQKWK